MRNASFTDRRRKNKMIEILIVDDEELARREMRSILASEKDVVIVGEAANGIEAVEKVIRLRPKLMFLDIEMPGINGFDVVNSLGHSPAVIFVTAYDQYAIQAFEAQALDYMLKPVTPDRVRRALSRATHILGSDVHSQAPAIQQLLSMMQRARAGSISRIAVQKGAHIVLINVRDIVYINVEDRLVFVYTESDRYLIDKTVSELNEMYGGEGFFQIHRGTIINLDYLVEIIPWFSGTYHLKLKNGKELPLSRDRAPRLKEILGLSKRGLSCPLNIA